MKKTGKLVAILLIFSTLAFFLAGCASKEENLIKEECRARADAAVSQANEIMAMINSGEQSSTKLTSEEVKYNKDTGTYFYTAIYETKVITPDREYEHLNTISITGHLKDGKVTIDNVKAS